MSLKKMKKKTQMVTVITLVASLGISLQDCSSNLMDKVSNQSTLEAEVEKDVKENPPEFPKTESKSGFSIKSMNLVSEGLKGNLFNNKEEGFGSGSQIEASGFKKDTEYFWQFSSTKPIALEVWKKRNNNWVYDGIRWPENGYTFHKAGFRNPDFDVVYIRPYSFALNNQITSSIMTVHGVKNGDYIGPDESTRIYGAAGTNTETYNIPVTLNYGGKSVSRLTCNKKAYPKLASFLAALRSSGVLAKNNSYSGAYNYRYIANSSVLSNHSWGAAIDLFTSSSNTGKFINDNPVIKELAQKHDFAWGGYWGKSYDPMHFELVNPNF